METRANFVLIGAFVFLALGALVLFSIWISKAQFNREYSVYNVVFEWPINGLTEGGEVRFNGIKVGEVTELGLNQQDPSEVIARIRIDATTPVRVNSVATLGFQGVTGVTYIQISAGDIREALLKDVAVTTPPKIQTARTEFEELFAGGKDMIASSTETLQKFSEVLSKENIDHFSSILQNIDAITTQAAKDGELVDEVREAVNSLAQAGVTVDRAAIAIDEAASHFDARFALIARDALTFLEGADEALDSAETLFDGAGTAVDDLAATLGPGAEDVLVELANAARDMRILIDRLDAVVQDVERDPREFVLGDNKPFEQ